MADYLEKLKALSIGNNIKLINIDFLKNIKKLETLNIHNLSLTDEIQTVNILKSFPNLKKLHCCNTFKKINIKKF